MIWEGFAKGQLLLGIKLYLDVLDGRLKTCSDRWYNHLIVFTLVLLPKISIILFLYCAVLHCTSHPRKAMYLVFQRPVSSKRKLGISFLKSLGNIPRTIG